MRFCSVCDNMLFIALQAAAPPAPTGTAEDDGGSGAGAPSLVYRCKHCGNEERDDGGDRGGGGGSAARVTYTRYSDDRAATKPYTTAHLRHDPTLPRANNIPCPSESCTRPKDAPNRVIFVKYDATRLRYLYCCEHCGTFWKSSDATHAPAAPV